MFNSTAIHFKAIVVSAHHRPDQTSPFRVALSPLRQFGGGPVAPEFCVLEFDYSLELGCFCLELSLIVPSLLQPPFPPFPSVQNPRHFSRISCISRFQIPFLCSLRSCRLTQFYSCHSCDSWATDLAPAMSGATFTIPFCLPGFSTVGSRGVAPFPQGMSAYVEHLAGTKPESFARGSYVRSAGWRTVPVCLAFGPKPSLSRQSLPAAAEAQIPMPPRKPIRPFSG